MADLSEKDEVSLDRSRLVKRLQNTYNEWKSQTGESITKAERRREVSR